MISSQPALRDAAIVILMDMILMSRKDPGTGVLEIHLHDAKTLGVTRRMAKIDARSNLQKRSVERFPVQVEA